MARARDIAFIRTLCALELPAQTLVQSLLPALRGLLPAHSAGVFWVDPNGEMTGLYAERLLPPEAMAAYYQHHYQTRHQGFAAVFRARAQRDDAVSCHSFTPAEQHTAYFREVLQPLDAYHVLYGILRNATHAFAQISFYRGQVDRPFDNADRETLSSVLRYISTGLGRVAHGTRPDDASVVVEEQLGIIGPGGVIAGASEAWRRLLRLAVLAQVTPSGATQEHSIVDAFLARLYDGVLAAAATGRAAPEMPRNTPWGRFSMRPFVLRKAGSAQDDQVGLLIRREEPRALSLVRGTGLAGMSPQQREVALLLAQGKSNREIADGLGLAFNTASYHVKQVYARLDVNDRNAVGETLLRLAHSAAAAS